MNPTIATTKKAIALATRIGFDYIELPEPAKNGFINAALISQLGFDLTNDDITRNVNQSLDSYIRKNNVDAFLAAMELTRPEHSAEVQATRASDYPL